MDHSNNFGGLLTLAGDRQPVCAVVVTYHPDTEFRNYLKHIREQFHSTLLVDNGSRGPALDMLRDLAYGNVALHEMGANTGLGVALNHGITEALSKEYKWVALFDQDTQPIGDMIQCFSDILSSHPTPNKVAIIGSRFYDRNKSPSPPDSISGIPCDHSWVEKRRVITSGSLLSLAAFTRIGPFREDLFIDSIDHEYCYRAKLQGWVILQATATLISHSVGNYRKHRLFGQIIWRSHHSAVRCYFMARNRMLLAGERCEYSKYLRGALAAIQNSFLILMLEEDKLAKIRATFSGYLAGVMNNTLPPDWIRQKLG